MASVAGADIDQLRALARSFAQSADRLDGVTREVSGRLSAPLWLGPDADRYKSQWQGQSTATLRNASQALRGAATAIERNATEQELASSSGGGLTAAAAATALSGGGSTNLFNWLVDARDFLGDAPLWPLNNGTVIGATPFGPLVPFFDALGLAFDDRISPEHKIIDAGGALADLAGGLLRDVPNPVAYLSGVAISQWSDVVTMAAKTDFSSSALNTVGDYIAKDPGGAFNAAKDAVVGYIPKLFSNFF